MTSFCEISIIELPRVIREYQGNKQDEMLQWMMFLDNPENKEVAEIMEENEDIKEAKEELDKISQDDLLRRMALKADLAQRDHEQLMYEAERDGRELGLKLGREEGLEEGLKEGQEKGIKEGEKKAKLETAQKMLEEEITLEQVMRITGLTREEIIEDIEKSKK